MHNCQTLSKFCQTAKTWSGGAMVLGKLPVPGHPRILIIVGQGPIALRVGAYRGCLDICTLLYIFPISPSPRGTTRYRLKYCLKGPINPKQPTNQPTKKRKKIPKTSIVQALQTFLASELLPRIQFQFFFVLGDGEGGRAITEFMYTIYSFCYNLHSQGK